MSAELYYEVNKCVNRVSWNMSLWSLGNQVVLQITGTSRKCDYSQQYFKFVWYPTLEKAERPMWKGYSHFLLLQSAQKHLCSYATFVYLNQFESWLHGLQSILHSICSSHWLISVFVPQIMLKDPWQAASRNEILQTCSKSSHGWSKGHPSLWLVQTGRDL